VAVGVDVGVGSAVGVAVGVDVGVGSNVGVAVGVGDGSTPASAGDVSARIIPGTSKMQLNFMNRFITVISPVATQLLGMISSSHCSLPTSLRANHSCKSRGHVPRRGAIVQATCQGRFPLREIKTLLFPAT